MKKGKKIAGVVLTMAVAGMLTGCVDNMPDLTDEQSQLIAEYAADLLLKYSPNYNTKLVDIEEITQEETDVSETKETEETTQGTKEEQSTVEIVEPETNPQDVDFAEEEGLQDFTLKYASYEISDSYPKDATGYRVDATEGNSLLIVHFILTNESEESIECNFFEKNPSISVAVDGKRVKAMSSMLDDDLTTYMDTVEAGEEKDLVVIFEVDSEQATSADITMQFNTTEIALE